MRVEEHGQDHCGCHDDRGHGPRYCVNTEGNEHNWSRSTITTEEIAALGGWPASQGVIQVNEDNTERTLAPGEVVELRPGHAFCRRVRWKRGFTRSERIVAEAAEERIPPSIEVLGAANLHRSVGLVVLVLASIRLVWRVFETPPGWPLTMHRHEILLARIAHAAFYVLLFALPLTGWVLATLGARRLSFLGLFDLPQLSLPGLSPQENLLKELHELLFHVLFWLGVLHVVAALKHQFVDRDRELRRML